MRGPDTNVLVRFLLRDDPVQARAAKSAIDGATAQGEPLLVSLLTILEYGDSSNVPRAARAWVNAAVASIFFLPVARNPLSVCLAPLATSFTLLVGKCVCRVDQAIQVIDVGHAAPGCVAPLLPPDKAVFLHLGDPALHLPGVHADSAPD